MTSITSSKKRTAHFTRKKPLAKQRHLKGELRELKRKIKQKDAALEEMLQKFKAEKKRIAELAALNMESFVRPALRSLGKRLPENDKRHLLVIEKNLEGITSTFGEAITQKLFRLSRREIQICYLIRDGLSTKDIAETFHVSPSTVENQRNSIRKKIGIAKNGVALKIYLQNL